MNGLIGHTGFVGGNLLAQTGFDRLYHSKNIAELPDTEFDVLVCAGAPAAKWIANQRPDEDWRAIASLMDALGRTRAELVILISTIDVYSVPVSVDEDTAIDTAALLPYGKHRHLLEEMVRRTFPRRLVVRLPGLFGAGLKKNVVYDFLNHNRIDRIDHRAVFQFYSLAHLWRDVRKALDGGITLLNLATEPVSVAEVARRGFGIEFENACAGRPAHYDIRSRHARLWGATGGYLYAKDSVLDDLRQFVARSRAGGD